MKKFLAIFLPYWSTDLLQRKQEAPSPLFLTAQERTKSIVARRCRECKKAGVQPGMQAATAQMYLPKAQALPFNLGNDRRALEQLARWAYSFSPLVAADEALPLDPRTSGIMLDVTGSEKLLGDDPTLLAVIAERLEQLGFQARLAIAPTIGAAWALSRYSTDPLLAVDHRSLRNTLAPLPLAALRLSADLLTALTEVNLKTSADLFPLSRSSLLARFGPELLRRYDQAFGRQNEVLVGLTIEGPLAVRRVFSWPVTSREILKDAARLLLTQLIHLLEQHNKKLRLLTVMFRGPHHTSLSKNIPLSFPTANEKHLWRILERHLEELSLSEGVEGVALIAARDDLRVPIPANYLTDEESSPNEFGELLDTLRQHLGTSRVLAICTQQSHIPERSFHYQQKIPEVPLSPAALINAERPSVLLERPEPVRTMAVLPDSPPFWIAWREQQYDISTGIGPERIAPEWWKDLSASTRDYFRVQLSTGTWLWLFRELESARWYLHGIWA